MKIYMRDIIALVVILGLYVSNIMGVSSGVIDTSVALIIGYYFSKRVFEETERI